MNVLAVAQLALVVFVTASLGFNVLANRRHQARLIERGEAVPPALRRATVAGIVALAV